jgi:hypothetical protein
MGLSLIVDDDDDEAKLGMNPEEL